jgi:FkbM family methyltransferase
MLINFKDIVNRYGKPNGIIHIGAHLMEERDAYLSYGLNNTIWVEANPNIYLDIKYINDINTNEKCFNYAISDKDDEVVNFKITNNGQSSSILDLELHSFYYPSITVIETLNVKTKRMDTLIKENNLKIENYDFLNIDIQGAELLALKSFGNLLNDVKFIYTEINTNKLYKDCALVGEIDDYLLKYGFNRIETVMTQVEWGDALYIKK